MILLHEITVFDSGKNDPFTYRFMAGFEMIYAALGTSCFSDLGSKHQGLISR